MPNTFTVTFYRDLECTKKVWDGITFKTFDEAWDWYREFMNRHPGLTAQIEAA